MFPEINWQFNHSFIPLLIIHEARKESIEGPERKRAIYLNGGVASERVGMAGDKKAQVTKRAHSWIGKQIGVSQRREIRVRMDESQQFSWSKLCISSDQFRQHLGYHPL